MASPASALVRRADGLFQGKAAALALITGGFIASYSVIDGIGARVAGTSLGFYGWLAVINGVVLALLALGLRPRCGDAALAPDQNAGAWWRGVFCGLCAGRLCLYTGADRFGHGPARDQHRICPADRCFLSERAAEPA